VECSFTSKVLEEARKRKTMVGNIQRSVRGEMRRGLRRKALLFLVQ